MNSGKDVVISGIAGRLPECENVNEFWQSLFDGVDLITDDDRRFPPGKVLYYSILVIFEIISRIFVFQFLEET